MLARRNRERPVRIHSQRPQHHHIVLHHCSQRKNLATQRQSRNGRRHRSRHGSRKEQQVPLCIRQRRPCYRGIRSPRRRQPHMATDDQRNPSRSRRTSSKLDQDLFTQVQPPFSSSNDIERIEVLFLSTTLTTLHWSNVNRNTVHPEPFSWERENLTTAGHFETHSLDALSWGLHDSRDSTRQHPSGPQLFSRR